MTGTDICLERETANDESGLVVAIHVASGAAVQKDDVLFDIENSKATQEVVAPDSGILSHDLKLGQTVAFGVPIARVLTRADRQMETVAPALPAGGAPAGSAADRAAILAGGRPAMRRAGAGDGPRSPAASSRRAMSAPWRIRRRRRHRPNLPKSSL